MTYDMLIRKKALKIQERLGMRIGIGYGTKAMPVVKNFEQATKVLRELYRIGMKAFVLPRELFSDIETSSDLYKKKYGELLKIREEAKKMNIELSLHHNELSDMPDEELKIFCTIASIMDCRIFTIQPDFYKMMPPDQARRLVVHKISEIVSELRTKARIGIETTGSINELGSLDDVIDIVRRTQQTEPVINWAHVHARGGGMLRTQKDFSKVIEEVKNKAGYGQAWLKNAYFFFSGVSYGPYGEKKHIPLADSDINLEYLIREIMSFTIKGTLIFEDPDREKFILKTLDNLGDMVR